MYIPGIKLLINFSFLFFFLTPKKGSGFEFPRNWQCNSHPPTLACILEWLTRLRHRGGQLEDALAEPEVSGSYLGLE